MVVMVVVMGRWRGRGWGVVRGAIILVLLTVMMVMAVHLDVVVLQLLLSISAADHHLPSRFVVADGGWAGAGAHGRAVHHHQGRRCGGRGSGGGSSSLRMLPSLTLPSLFLLFIGLPAIAMVVRVTTVMVSTTVAAVSAARGWGGWSVSMRSNGCTAAANADDNVVAVLIINCWNCCCGWLDLLSRASCSRIISRHHFLLKIAVVVVVVVVVVCTATTTTTTRGGTLHRYGTTISIASLIACVIERHLSIATGVVLRQFILSTALLLGQVNLFAWWWWPTTTMAATALWGGHHGHSIRVHGVEGDLCTGCCLIIITVRQTALVRLVQRGKVLLEKDEGVGRVAISAASANVLLSGGHHRHGRVLPASKRLRQCDAPDGHLVPVRSGEDDVGHAGGRKNGAEGGERLAQCLRHQPKVLHLFQFTPLGAAVGDAVDVNLKLVVLKLNDKKGRLQRRVEAVAVETPPRFIAVPLHAGLWNAAVPQSKKEES